MKKNAHYLDQKFKTQRGTTLVVCLIILLVMSLIGVTSISNSTLQQRMAFNLRQQQLAENAAEHALRTGEKYIAENMDSTLAIDNFSADQSGNFYTVVDIRGKQYTQTNPNSLDIAFWGTNGIEVTGINGEAVSKNPRYIIELIGKTQTGTGRKITHMSSGTVKKGSQYNFRITAIGWGKDSNTYSILQSTYATTKIYDT